MADEWCVQAAAANLRTNLSRRCQEVVLRGRGQAVVVHVRRQPGFGVLDEALTPFLRQGKEMRGDWGACHKSRDELAGVWMANGATLESDAGAFQCRGISQGVKLLRGVEGECE